jgi:hypothetical protein
MPKAATAPRIDYTAYPIETALETECPLDHTPNAETLAAIEEGRAMLAGKLPGHNFKSFEEFWASLRRISQKSGCPTTT